MYQIAGTSNLIKHLQKQCHEKEYKQYLEQARILELEKAKSHTPRSAKRLKFKSDIKNDPMLSHRLNFATIPK